MSNNILDLINKYEQIVIYRHGKPDIDALGSQLGLKQLLIDNFPLKKVYAVGDMSRPCFLGEMDNIDDEICKNSLAIIVDVACENMTYDKRYQLAKDVIIFDHHNNESDIKSTIYVKDIKAAAAAQMVASFAFENNLYVSKEAAKCLYSGIVTDNGRFLYSLSEDLFNVVSKLIKIDFNPYEIYQTLYAESLASKQMKAYFISKIKVTSKGVGYLINDLSVYDLFDVDTFTISRGMVNVMADVKEIDIWANFTKDRNNGKILCEFRSKNLSIVQIAKKYGGGGHDLACGCTIDNEETIYKIIEDFNNLL